MNKLREKFLLLQIRQHRDEGSFTELYDNMADAIYRFIYFKTSDSDIAQDLLSEVFLKSWKALTDPSAKEVKHLKAFLYVVARNTVNDYYRSATVRKESALETLAEMPQVLPQSEKIHDKIEAEQVLKVIKTLKDSYQEVLLLRYIDELSLNEIAQVLKKTPVAARVLLHRAHQALKREYEKIAK